MQLPFTHDAFLNVFGEYNERFWPVAVLLWCLTAAMFVLLVRSRGARSRVLSFLLAVQWLWAAGAYHALLFSKINPAAWLFAALFVAQAVALVREGVMTGRLRFALDVPFRAALACGFIAYALSYPLIAWTTGEGFPLLPTFGVPCPTTIATAGFLLATRHPLPRAVVVVPIVWAYVGGSAAFLLHVPADFVLLVAGVVLTVDTLISRPGAHPVHSLPPSLA